MSKYLKLSERKEFMHVGRRPRFTVRDDTETITLSHADGIWMATYSNPEIIEAFGCDTIPTAYTTKLDAVPVAEYIKAANPNASILFDFIL
jgi:hypothetical protein